MSENDKITGRQTVTGSLSRAALGTGAKQQTGRKIIRSAAGFVKEHISKQPPIQRFFSFMPTLLTRVSPFHFKGKEKFKEWPLVRLDSGDGNFWGKMRVVGELLVIFDETTLFCLLTLMMRYENDAFETTQVELGQLADIQPTPNAFGAIWKSIQRLAGTRIDLELRSGKSKRKKTVKEMTGSILSFADLDKETGNIRVVVNPYFTEMYAESFVTNIDLKFRASLKADISKAFYRFYQGQYGNESDIDIIRLARAVNLDTEQEMHRLRAKVRSGLQELRERAYLDKFEITKNNRVKVLKSMDAAINMDGQILGRGKIPYFKD